MPEELSPNKIAADVITDLAKTIAQKIYIKAIKYFKDSSAKESIDIGTAYEDYLNNAKERCEKIKTILYRHEPRELYSFYECVGILHNLEVIDTSDVNNLLKVGHKLIITGTGGIGKSIMMKHLFVNCVNHKKLIPVLTELRGLNDIDTNQISIDDYVYNNLINFKFNLEKKYYEYSLQEGCYLILFDGYDEINSNITGIVSKQINDFCNKYPDNYFILSSRPLIEFIGWSDFTELRANNLNKKQALSLINKLDYELTVKEKFYKELNESLYDKYESFASNPLLLTIMLITFENSTSIPDKLNDFYEQAFTTLFHTHDSTKGAYKRDILSKLGYEDFKAIFSHICFKSFFRSQYEFTENSIIEYINNAKQKVKINNTFNSEDYLADLINSVCMLIREGLIYRFSHRSFQEYLSALYTTQLDDVIQQKFISDWIKKTSTHQSSNYLNMLYDLQPERFIKNIIIPGLQEIRNKFHNCDNTLELIFGLFYDKIKIKKSNGNKGKERKFDLLISINESYYYEIIRYTLMINDYDYKSVGKKYDELSNAIARKLLDFSKGDEWTFNEIKTIGLYNDVVDAISWAKEQYDFCLEFLDNYEKNNNSKKRKFESILDDL